jgi:hypothetical protein
MPSPTEGFAEAWQSDESQLLVEMGYGATIRHKPGVGLHLKTGNSLFDVVYCT